MIIKPLHDKEETDYIVFEINKINMEEGSIFVNNNRID